MGNGNRVTGVITKSSTQLRGCGGLITYINVKLDEGEEVCYVPYIDKREVQMQIPGRHPVGTSRCTRAIIDYVCNSGVLWIKAYQLLDEQGSVVHSDVPDSN